MEQPLVLLVSLVLVSFCRGQNQNTPDFCHQKPCPEYKQIGNHEDFEERLYVATEWITTKIGGSGNLDLLAAHGRLKDYCKRQNDAGYKIPIDTWPVLITITEGNDLFLSWFVPPGTAMPENNDPSVSVNQKPEATVYVKIFNGTPSLQSGQENTDLLLKALDKNCTNLPTRSGAAYESYFSIHHHNEVWIYADDLKC